MAKLTIIRERQHRPFPLEYFSEATRRELTAAGLVGDLHRHRAKNGTATPLDLAQMVDEDLLDLGRRVGPPYLGFDDLPKPPSIE